MPQGRGHGTREAANPAPYAGLAIIASVGFRGWNAEESMQEWLDTHVGPSRTA